MFGQYQSNPFSWIPISAPEAAERGLGPKDAHARQLMKEAVAKKAYEDDLERQRGSMPETNVAGRTVGQAGLEEGSFVGYGGQDQRVPKGPKEALKLVTEYIVPTFGPELKVHSGDRTPKRQAELYKTWQIEAMRAMRMEYPDIVQKNFSDAGAGLNAGDLFKTLSGYQKNRVYNEMQGPKQVAPPGKSKHETGEAVDIGISAYMSADGTLSPMGEKIETELNRIGFFRPAATVRWDPNHFEFMGPQAPAKATGEAGTGTLAQSGGYAGIGAQAGERLLGEYAEGEDAERIAQIGMLRRSSTASKRAMVAQSGAIQKQIDDKNQQEQRIVRETFALEKKAADTMAKEEAAWAGTQEALDKKHLAVQTKVGELLQAYERRSSEIEKMGQDPRKTFGFVDEKGNWSWSKFGVTIGAAVGFLANALLTVGSKGRIPFVAWKMIDGMIDNELQQQKTAINSKYSKLNADLTLMGKLRDAFQDDKARLLGGKEARLKHTIDHLKAMQSKASLPTSAQEAINILIHKAEAQRAKVRADLTSSLYNTNYKTTTAISTAIRHEEQTQQGLTSAGLHAGQTAQSLSRRPIPKHIARMRTAAEAFPLVREAVEIWQKWGKHAPFLDKLGAGYAPDLLKTFNSFWQSDARAKMVRLGSIGDLLGPMLIRMTGETGNMAQSENLRGIRMIPTNDEFEDGMTKLRAVWGYLTMVGNEDFQNLPKESREKLLAHGFSNLPGAGDLTIRSAEHMKRVWEEALGSGSTTDDDFQRFRSTHTEVTFEELEADMAKEAE